MPSPPNIQLLEDAIKASGLSARGFAVGVLAVEERTVRYWLAGERDVPGTVLVICRTIVDNPGMAHVYLEAAKRIADETGVWPQRRQPSRSKKTE